MFPKALVYVKVRVVHRRLRVQHKLHVTITFSIIILSSRSAGRPCIYVMSTIKLIFKKEKKVLPLAGLNIHVVRSFYPSHFMDISNKHLLSNLI